jgi:glucose-6-phosphate 1-dehydrogenase
VELSVLWTQLAGALKFWQESESLVKHYNTGAWAPSQNLEYLPVEYMSGHDETINKQVN